MNKLFRYELRRLLCNKMFFGILLVSLGYGWLTLTGTVILGVANTAPFSPWSFGYYVGQVLPLICLGELFFLSFFTSKEELQIKPITQATPTEQRKYIAMRCGAVLAGTGLLALCAVALAIAFYVSLFGWIDYGNLIFPAILTLLPAIIFCLGAGLTLGRIHPNLIYPFMVVVFLLSLLPLPSVISLSLSGFFSQYPPTLDTLDPAFCVPGWLIISKIIFVVLGFILVVFAANVQEQGRDLFKIEAMRSVKN